MSVPLLGGSARGFAGLVTPLVARRVASCLDAVAAGTVVALENGSPAA
jgi:hypothetical protein